MLLELNEIGHEMSEIPFDQESDFNLNDLIKLDERNEKKSALIRFINQGNLLKEAILASTKNKNIPIRN